MSFPLERPHWKHDLDVTCNDSRQDYLLLTGLLVLHTSYKSDLHWRQVLTSPTLFFHRTVFVLNRVYFPDNLSQPSLSRRHKLRFLLPPVYLTKCNLSSLSDFREKTDVLKKIILRYWNSYQPLFRPLITPRIYYTFYIPLWTLVDPVSIPHFSTVTTTWY